MVSKDEPAVPALLLGLVVALFAVAWLVVGPAGGPGASAATLPVSAIGVAFSAR